MDTFDYAQSQEDALELITEFGSDFTLSTAPAYDEEGTPDPDTTSGKLVDLPAPTSRQDYVGSLDAEKWKYYIIAHKGLNFSPEVGFLVTVGNETYEIKEVRTLSPAGVAVIHETIAVLYQTDQPE